MSETITVQRRFPRVFLTGVLQDLRPLGSCKVVWPSGFESDIYDFGRTSASVYFPMRLNLTFQKGDVVKLGWRLGKNEPFFVDCRVIRGETRLLTVEFLRLTQSQYKTIDSFFTSEFIAEHMQEIPSSNFAPEQTFQHWFHGPMDTNLYLWRNLNGISRITFEFVENIFVWDEHGLMVGPSRDTLSYPTEDYAYYANYLSPLTSADLKSKELKEMLGFFDIMKINHSSEIKSQIMGAKNGS